ncbi:SdpA family antimicrobial peptide system protein [Flavobacterium sp. ZB4R12]|uniref:SdpA family antimicrobial peptide system protein n=1 Tax=Flavobacterium sp. ZB4R12 TaxID=3398732 RepID=UPI003AB06E2F
MKKQYLKLIFFYISIFCTILVVASILVISNSPNPITLNYNIPFKNNLNALAPQGWAFFTKDVHKDYFNIYSIKKGKINSVCLKSAELTQYFGIKRDNRIINHKIGTILKNINEELWYNFKGNVDKIPQDSLAKISINVKEPMIYGVYLIEEGNPLPYDWYKSNLKIHRTMKYIQLEIKNK